MLCTRFKCGPFRTLSKLHWWVYVSSSFVNSLQKTEKVTRDYWQRCFRNTFWNLYLLTFGLEAGTIFAHLSHPFGDRHFYASHFLGVCSANGLAMSALDISNISPEGGWAALVLTISSDLDYNFGILRHYIYRYLLFPWGPLKPNDHAS